MCAEAHHRPSESASDKPFSGELADEPLTFKAQEVDERVGSRTTGPIGDVVDVHGSVRKEIVDILLEEREPGIRVHRQRPRLRKSGRQRRPEFGQNILDRLHKLRLPLADKEIAAAAPLRADVSRNREDFAVLVKRRVRRDHCAAVDVRFNDQGAERQFSVQHITSSLCRNAKASADAMYQISSGL